MSVQSLIGEIESRGYGDFGGPHRCGEASRCGKVNSFICFGSNLIEVPHNTCWVDFGARTHISTRMHGFFTIQTTNQTNNFLFLGNRVRAPIEGIRTYRPLDSGCILDLLKTLLSQLLETLFLCQH